MTTEQIAIAALKKIASCTLSEYDVLCTAADALAQIEKHQPSHLAGGTRGFGVEHIRIAEEEASS